MANIGTFTKTEQGFVGEIVTLSFQARNVRMVPETNGTNENAPSHRVYVGRAEIGAARAAGRPWVLDPVAVGGLPVRTALARELLAHRPTAVRANASEILGLVGDGAGGRGVDATDEVDAAIGAARHLNESCWRHPTPR